MNPIIRLRSPLRRAVAPFALLLAFALLAACQETPSRSQTAWTAAELAGVLDLSELGRDLTADAEAGSLVLEGRPLPADVLERFPHLTMGRSKNLLRLAPDVILAMQPEARDLVLLASGHELRDRLADYGLTVADVQAAWGAGGEIDLAALRDLAARLDDRSIASASTAAVPPGSRLLLDLGVAR